MRCSRSRRVLGRLSARFKRQIEWLGDRVTKQQREFPDDNAVPKSAEQFGTDHGFTVEGLNLAAAHRQATLGKGYARESITKKRLSELKKGAVTMPPHRSWSGDYTNWTADPFNDLNWRFQFHTLRWINPFLWDAIDGNEDSKTEWKRIVASWAEVNTPPERAEDKYAWMDMTDGNRAIQTSIGAPLIDSGEQWYIDLLVIHRNWLLEDSNIVQGNHGLHQNLGLFVVACVLDDKIGIQRAIDRLSEQILQVFDENGVNEEGSVAYHQMNLQWWLQAQRRLELEGHSLPETASDRLVKAGQTMGLLMLPDGTKPQIGDGHRGKVQRGLHPFIDQVNKGQIQEQKLPTFHHFENGMTIFRSGWGASRRLKDESHTIIRHGADLRRHSHNDRGSVHIYNAGRRWITDGGFHSYQQRNPDRDYTKSRLAHSLVDLPQQKYDETGEVRVHLTEHSDFVHSIETWDTNFEAATWKRRVVFLPHINVWVIWDRVNAAEAEVITQQWLIDIGVEVNETRHDRIQLSDKDNTLEMQWFGDTPEIDTVFGERSSANKRGLIGIGWKRMKAATSIHANFQDTDVESIVVISDPKEDIQGFDLIERDPLESFCLRVNGSDETYHLEIDKDSSAFIGK